MDATIFISGETGVGKEIVAKHLYKKATEQRQVSL
ncbi:sigma 54-interacting transcriptional regulator [Sinobaca sp. H24]